MDPSVIPFAYVGVIALIAAVGAVPIVKTLRMRRALAEPLPENVCVACNSKAVDLIGPHACRCRDCGFVGGSGAAALARAQVSAQLAPKNAADALTLLAEARRALIAADGILNAASRDGVGDLLTTVDQPEKRINSAAAAPSA